MNFKTLLCTGIAVIVCFIFVQNFISSNNRKDTLIIGTTADYAPFVSINAQGEYEGFDIDIAIQLAEKMGKQLIIKDLGSMSPLFISLEQETIDAIIWGLSITQERLEKVILIRYQGEYTTSYPLIFWKNIPEKISTIQDMQNMTVCVEAGSSQDAVLNNYPFINKKYKERVDDALLDIQYAKADAALVEPAIARKFKNKYPEIQVIDVPLAPKDQVQGIGIAIKQSNINLAEEIQKNIMALQQEGVITQLEQKWNIS
ncbi:MAG TPA: transporter substrate-binding domain-containing protein [Candidatus Babeliales bacterium]|nr:transporter substrate-binding domain-containing protein [Candidatus Babeliales bacterium]